MPDPSPDAFSLDRSPSLPPVADALETPDKSEGSGRVVRKRIIRGGVIAVVVGFFPILCSAILQSQGLSTSFAIVLHSLGLAISLGGFCVLLVGFRWEWLGKVSRQMARWLEARTASAADEQDSDAASAERRYSGLFVLATLLPMLLWLGWCLVTVALFLLPPIITGPLIFVSLSLLPALLLIIAIYDARPFIRGACIGMLLPAVAGCLLIVITGMQSYRYGRWLTDIGGSLPEFVAGFWVGMWLVGGLCGGVAWILYYGRIENSRQTDARRPIATSAKNSEPERSH